MKYKLLRFITKNKDIIICILFILQFVLFSLGGIFNMIQLVSIYLMVRIAYIDCD